MSTEQYIGRDIFSVYRGSLPVAGGWQGTAATDFSAHQRRIIEAVTAAANGASRLRFTQIKPEHIDLSLIIDYTTGRTSGADANVPLDVIWRTFQALVSDRFMGGVGISAVKGNAHLHVDTFLRPDKPSGVPRSYYFIETQAPRFNIAKGRLDVADLPIDSPQAKPFLEQAEKFFNHGIVDTLVHNLKPRSDIFSYLLFGGILYAAWWFSQQKKALGQSKEIVHGAARTYLKSKGVTVPHTE